MPHGTLRWSWNVNTLIMHLLTLLYKHPNSDLTFCVHNLGIDIQKGVCRRDQVMQCWIKQVAAGEHCGATAPSRPTY